ncbi:hypothetical protein BGZ83_006203 [Gryganskiella cystojenkinii]|nr:hypothetical protein BGZ83_006203 [Gryganskiella cystojenkinii]
MSYDQSQQQQQYYPQQSQPEVGYTGAHTTTAAPHPIVTRLDGRNLSDKIVRHQFEQCCVVVPLHTGAMIISFLMTVFYGYCGLALLTSSIFHGVYSVLLIIVGILYLFIAVASGYGFVGIYKEELIWVDRFINFYVIGSIVWAVLQLIQVIIMGIAYHTGGSWVVSWIVTFLIGFAFQYYFCCCLVSYQRALHARLNAGGAHAGVAGKHHQMV